MKRGKITRDILKIPDDMGYWLLRADGGKFYEDFFLNGFIAISDNNVDLKSINTLEEKSIAGITIDHIKELYQKEYPDRSNQQIAHAASRTHKFYSEINIGDLILVPSKRSEYFLLGIVKSGMYEITKDGITSGKEVHYPINTYLKRRRVSWVKEVSRIEIPDKLYWILSAHQTIFNLEDDRAYINQLLSPIYIQNNVTHGAIKISKKEGLISGEWFELHSVIKRYSDKSNDEVTIKSNVQSPGIIEFVSSDTTTILSIVIVLSAGIIGDVSIFGFKFKGIIPYIQSHKKITKEIEVLDEEKKSIQIDNDRKKFELEKDKEIWDTKKETEAELKEQLKISSFDAGKTVGEQTQKDNLGNPDSDES